MSPQWFWRRALSSSASITALRWELVLDEYMFNFWREYRSWPWLETHMRDFWYVRVQGHTRHIADRLWMASSSFKHWDHTHTNTHSNAEYSFIRVQIHQWCSALNASISLHSFIHIRLLYRNDGTHLITSPMIHDLQSLHNYTRFNHKQIKPLKPLLSTLHSIHKQFDTT